MNEQDSIRELEKRWAVEYWFASLKFYHRKYKGVNTLYITTKGAYKVESGRLISFYFPIDLIKSDYSTLTYTYRVKNETQSNRHERDTDDG
jgi:hypothetical protein